MFERFSDAARAVVVGAQDHARRLGHDHIGAEHLLLTLATTDSAAGQVVRASGLTPAAVEGAIRRLAPAAGTLDREALALIGIDLDTVRERVEAAFGPDALLVPPRRHGRWRRRRPGPPPSGHIPFAADAKKVLELALREALAARTGHIGAEHLAAGLTRLDDGAVPRVLAAVGVRPAALRAAVLARHRQAG